MFLLLGLLWVLLGAIPLFRAVRHRAQENSEARIRRGVIILVIDLAILAAVTLFFAISTEFWWFESTGYEDRFWTEYSWRVLLFAVGAAAGALLFPLGLRSLYSEQASLLRRIAMIVAAVTGGVIAGLLSNALWQPLLLFLNRSAGMQADPVFGLDVTFYLFGVPLFEAIRGRLIALLIAYAAVAALSVAVVSGAANSREAGRLLAKDGRLRAQVYAVAGLFLLLAGARRLLAIPQLMFSPAGAVTGVGWLEANVLVFTNFLAAAILVAVGVIGLMSCSRDAFLRRILAVRRIDESGELRFTSRSWVTPVVVGGSLFLLVTGIPALARALILNPNEITLESEYLPHHIGFTRDAFGINDDRVVETQYDVGTDIDREVLAANQPTMDNIRLWDWRALQDNLSQRQEIRLYYEFNDVDIDRYEIDGELTQVMISVRELEKDALDAASQTWVSRHFKYTHGYGLVALPVNEFLPQGRPDLLVQNIPPVSTVPRFDLSRPEIYYGERTTDHVYVKTSQQEFDYPSGDQNVYADYTGDGGVPIGGLVRRLAFAWRIDGYRQLLSSYFRPDSRIMFRREITERARAIAPFLTYDRDPYPVVTEDGRIVFIIDAYTTSSAYPYSEPYTGTLDVFRGVNYIRNSVKVVVDAYDGSIDFYTVTPDDPLIATFGRVFDDLFQPIDAMPEDLKAHIRYPADLLTVQAQMYGTYHMTDIQVFYQREDVWQFATERYRANFQDVEPYYVMLQYPEEEQTEFVLMLPFTPQNKNLINAWLAGRSRYDRYGEITVYPLPKGVEVLGPRQIEARIDQNTEMSQALSLWGQRGSEVVRGNLLTIPLFANDLLYILYVEPIYLQAEDAQLPEIKRVALADQNRVVWSEEFEGAIDRLLGELPPTPGSISGVAAESQPEEEEPQAAVSGEEVAAEASVSELVERANGALARYQRAVSDGRFADAGGALEELQEMLSQLESPRDNP